MMSTIRVAALLLAACGLAWAEQPEVWVPAQQAPSASQSGGQQPATDSGQMPEEKQPVPPATQPLQPQPGQQPAAPGTTPAKNEDDPRVDQPMQPLEPIAGTAPTVSQPEPSAPVVVPDTTPLNSPQELTLGSEGGGRNYLYPSIRYTQYVDNSTGQGTMTVISPVGSLDFNHAWRKVQTSFTYSLGGTVFPSDSAFNSSFQSLNLSSSAQFGRWSLNLADAAGYTPEASFGYYGLNGLGGGSMGGGYLPNQSILTPQQARISNSVSLTLTRNLSARSSMHVSGGWGILRYQSGGTVGLAISNTNQYNFSAGYDRTFGANSLGISYLGSISDTGTTETMTTHGVSLAYARRLTGRLALQLGGGPAIRIVDAAGFPSDSGPTWEARAGLTYALGRLMLTSTFNRYSSSGAGILGAANTLVWETTAARQFGRMWNGNVSFGIARNSTLAEAAVQNQFNTEFVGLQISRMLGRDASLFLSYNFQHQNSDIPVCLVCGTVFDRNVFGIGFEWHKKPMGLPGY